MLIIKFVILDVLTEKRIKQEMQTRIASKPIIEAILLTEMKAALKCSWRVVGGKASDGHIYSVLWYKMPPDSRTKSIIHTEYNTRHTESLLELPADIKLGDNVKLYLLFWNFIF